MTYIVRPPLGTYTRPANKGDRRRARPKNVSHNKAQQPYASFSWKNFAATDLARALEAMEKYGDLDSLR